MFVKILKIAGLLALGYLVFLVTTQEGAYWTRFKLYRLLLTKPIEKIQEDYANQSCKTFSVTEKNQNYFEAFVTGYCKPRAKNFKLRKDFLCAVALNCSCPNGINQNDECASATMHWQTCNEFNDAALAYCHQTASSLEPKAGHVAADWNCFPQGTPLEINDKTYHVTDKGGIIKGRRIDIWFDDCEEALKATGIYKIKIPKL